MAKRPCRAAALEDVGVDHRRLHAFVTEQFLHDTKGIAVLQEVRGKSMAEGVAVLPIPDEEARPCRVMVAAGDVDRVPGEAQPSVDSLRQVLFETLRGLVVHLKTRRGPMAAAREEETA